MDGDFNFMNAILFYIAIYFICAFMSMVLAKVYGGINLEDTKAEYYIKFIVFFLWPIFLGLVLWLQLVDAIDKSTDWVANKIKKN